MRRGGKPAKPKVEAKPPVARKSPKTGASRVRDLENRLEEALEQQTATAEILRVISSSPTDVEPVFSAILANALRLCGADQGGVFTFDGHAFRVAAISGKVTREFREALASELIPPGRETPLRRVALERRPLQVADIQNDPGYSPPTIYRAEGMRTTMAVPLLKEGELIGALTFHRREVRLFTEQQISMVETFADQAVIAIENVRLFKELEARNRDLTEALDQQTATAGILRTISQTHTDVQPVFEAIADSLMRLLGTWSALVFTCEGQTVRLVAARGGMPGSSDAIMERLRGPQQADENRLAGLVVRTRAVQQVEDVETETRFPGLREGARARGFRSTVQVPMLRDGEVIGIVAVTRREPGAYAATEIALLQTFADQAVIAIENVRLFTETKEALEQQTATSEMLRVISRSPTDIQPVFDAIVRSGAALCQAPDIIILIADRDSLRVAATVGPVAVSVQQSQLLQGGVLPLTRGSVSGRAFIDRRTVHVHDVGALSDDEFPEGKVLQQEYGGHGTTLAVPLLREEMSLGVITLLRSEVSPFTDRQVALLQTFADQAVIAIENVRLFTELQTSNRELTTALDTQTATSDILRVISRSQTDVQPVFDAIVASAIRLLGGYSGGLGRVEGDQIVLAAYTSVDEAGDDALRASFPRPLHGEEHFARAIRERAPINVHDVLTDPRISDAARASARARGVGSAVIVPLLRQDEAIGVISVTRRQLGGFTDDEITLLKTFADQAVIAIENARLLTELQARTQELTRSVDQLTALGEVGRAVSSTLDLETVLTTIVSRAVQLSGLDGGVVHEYDENAEEFVHRAQAETGGTLAAVRRAVRIPKGQGVIGRTAITLEPVQVSDITVPGAYVGPQRENLIESGIRALLAVPMVRESRLIGCLGVTRNRPGEFPAETIELLRTFSTQSALAIQNARLFHEIEDKSRQLEAASRHKSEFLANMSHELRTPLNAIIGFSEVLAERMFGEVNAKQAEYLQDILESGRHLLSLINDILDLSKIEAGRMELEPADFHLPGAIDNALILVRERATRHGITLGCLIDEGLGTIRGDERKVKQVLLNLLSNALKFTPEGGRVDVRASLREGRAEVSVADTGVGIALEDQAAVFEEFRQVGTADKKVEGTGLGLALSQKFVQLHGGRLWVESELGRGSTFTFTLPVS